MHPSAGPATGAGMKSLLLAASAGVAFTCTAVVSPGQTTATGVAIIMPNPRRAAERSAIIMPNPRRAQTMAIIMPNPRHAAALA